MTIVTLAGMPGIPAYTNPTLQPGLDALSTWLEDHHYSQHAREAILAHTSIEGTLAGTPYLVAEDETAAEAAFVAGLEPVSASSDAWHAPDVYLDVESLLEPRGAVPIAPPSTPTRRPWSIEADREADRRRLAADPELAAIIRGEPSLAAAYRDCLPPAPVAGGAPEPDDASDPMAFPRTKTAADRRADQADVIRFYREHPEPAL